MDAALYLADVAEKFPKALDLQCIPTDHELWQIGNYEKFLEARRALLASHINAFLDGITVTEEAFVSASIEDLIKEGESDELEFKATLRWDIKEGGVSKKLEQVIVKTVAAFANTQGGSLLIGVDNDGQAVGLSRDYESLGEANRDQFELHLRNVLNQHLGTAFVASKIQIQFHAVNDVDVCQVDITTAKEPVIVAVKDKNGQAIEKFYARSGKLVSGNPDERDGFLRQRAFSLNERVQRDGRRRHSSRMADIVGLRRAAWSTNRRRHTASPGDGPQSHSEQGPAAGSPTGYWRMSRHVTVQRALRNAYFDSLGLPRLSVSSTA